MHIRAIDQRGTEAEPSGYIIFSDLARLAYNRPALAGLGGPQWRLGGPGTTTWPPVTNAHHDMALAHLDTHGTKVPDVAAA